jgi:hypothetical protein
MRTLVFALLFEIVGIVGCGGGLHPAPKDGVVVDSLPKAGDASPIGSCSNPWSGDNDPRSVCSVDCNSNDATSDVTAHIVQAAIGAGSFVAHVKQTRPVSADITFTAVTALWSGHFFNFEDTSSQLPLKFHLLTRGGGAGDIDNIQIYTNDNDPSGGPVNAGSLVCALRGN